MDKYFVLRAEKSLKMIKRKLLLNDKIRKLLYYDSSALIDGENIDIPSPQLVKDNIFLQPVVSNDIDPPFNKKNYIAITLAASGFAGQADLAAEHAIKIAVMVHKTNWIFGEDNNIRVLHLFQEIVNELDGLRLACSNTLMYEQALQTVIDESMTGYSIMFGIVDGLGVPENEREFNKI